MTFAAADVDEQALPAADRGAERGVSRYDPTWRLQRCLEYRDRGDLRAAQFLDEAVAVRIARTEALGRLDAVVVVHRVVGELANRHDGTDLVEGAHDQVRWRTGEADGGQALNSGRVVAPVRQARQAPEFDAQRLQCHAATGGQRVALRPKLGGHRACQELDVTGTEHADGPAAVADVLQQGPPAALVDGAAQRNRVVLVECRKVEALGQHENVGHDVSPTAGKRQVVTAGAGIGVRRRDAVEPEREAQ